MATGPTQVHPAVLTPSQLAGLSPADRRAYFSSLPQGDQARAMAAYAEARRIANAHYMAASIPKWAVCPPASGSGTTQNYAAGTTLLWNLPTAGGAFAQALLFTCNLTLTMAAGASALYAANAGAPYNLFSEVRVLYNGVQVRTHPIITKYMAALRGYDRARPSVALQNNNATLDAALVGTTPVAVGANTWNFVFRLPLAVLHEAHPAGCLPMMGSGTQAQVALDCAPGALGADPLLFATAATTGTGQAVTVTGTIKIEVIYFDGTNLYSPTPLKLDLDGEPTAQYYIDTPVTPLAAGVTTRQRIATLLQHYFVIAIVIDGQQSTTFSTIANLQGFELDEDSVGQNVLMRFGTGTNISINDYYEWIRYFFTQDLDQGVIVWVAGAQRGQTNPSNREGQQILNMVPGGWTDINHGYNLIAIQGVAGITARVQTYLVSANPAGLLIV